MADPVVFTNAYVAISTSTAAAYAELSGNKSVEWPMSRAELDDTVMGDAADSFFPGRLSVPVTLVHRQDFTTGGIDAKLWPLFNSKTLIRLKVRPVDSAVATTNPSYILHGCRIFSLTPLSGAHGVALEQRVEIRLASGHNFARDTST